MATVKQTKTITGSTSSSTWTWKQVITESWNDDYLTTNKSIVKVETYMGRKSGSSTASFGGTATTKIICDGETRSKSQNWIYQSFWISGGGWKLIQTEQFEVEHDADGTKTIEVSSSLSTSDFNPNSASAKGSVTLTTIPRTTECPNLDGYIESGATIALNPASTSFKHRIYYEYGEKSGYYPSSTTFFTNTGTLPLDTSFYAETPKSSGTGSITLYTYTSDGTLVGSDSGTITVRCDESKCKPTITATIVDINSATTDLTDSDAKLVKGYSTAQITYTISPRNSASISSKTVNGIPLQASPHKINNVSTGSFKIVATDSRGFSTTLTKTNTLINYIPLTLDFTAFRPTPTGSAIAVNFQGNYFNGSFGSVSNILTLSWKYRLKGTSSWTNGGTFTKDTHYTISGNKFTSKGDVTLSTTLFPYENNYEIAIYYSDKLIDTATTKPVPKGKPVINWEDNLVNVNGELTINDTKIFPKNILCAYLSTSATVTTNTDQRAKIPFDKYGVIGDKLTFNSSNKTIVIGKGVSKISIRGSICYTHDSSLGNAGISIMKNGGVLTEKLNSSYGTTRTYANMNIDASCISVVEGDLIHLMIRSVAKTDYSIALDYGIGVTNLTIEVLE